MQRLPLVSIVAVILLLTFNPFDFQPFQPSEAWVVRGSLEDIARNILLFLPFGMVVRHRYRCPHWMTLLCGFGLSLLVETTQLFIVIRTSNLIDLLSNSGGALLGSVIHQRLFSKSLPSTSELPIAMMFVPLCWMSALRAFWNPSAAWCVLPSAIAAILFIQLSPPRRLPRLQQFAKALAAALLSVLTIIPLFNASPRVAVVLLCIAPLVAYYTYKFNPLSPGLTGRFVLCLTLTGLAIALYGAVAWMRPDNRIFGSQIVLHCGELLLFVAVIISTFVWRRDRV
ncbi:MAG: VanZ family protein [Cyanobacteria bacterium J06555_13]